MKRKCTQCKLFSEESTVSYYRRAVMPKIEKPYICKDCTKINFLFSNPHIIEKREAEKQKNLQKRLQVKKFQDFVNRNAECFSWLQDIKKHRLKKHSEYLKTDKGKEIYRNSMAFRRAKKKDALIEISIEERHQIRKFYANRPEGYHVDHIIPLSKGGKHTLCNLQYLKAEENNKKHNKLCLKTLKSFLPQGQKISVSWLQYKFKILREDAEKIMLTLGIEEAYEN